MHLLVYFKDKTFAIDRRRVRRDTNEWLPLTLSFHRASICEGGLGSCNSLRLSVRLSVCLSVTRVDCDKIKWCTGDIFVLHERAITVLSDTNSGWWSTPPLWNLRSKWPTLFEKRWLRPISAYNMLTVRDSEKSSIMTDTNSTTRFSTSYTWSAYVPLSQKGWLKKRFFRFLK